MSSILGVIMGFVLGMMGIATVDYYTEKYYCKKHYKKDKLCPCSSCRFYEECDNSVFKEKKTHENI